MKIMAVDDDLELLGLIGFALRQAGYLVIEEPDGRKAIETFQRELPDLVVLDVNLQGISGFDLCHSIRAGSDTPVMMLTVLSSEEDEVKGLDLGADDYLTKPFSPRSLLARVRALLRRGENKTKEQFVRLPDLDLDLENQSISRSGAAPVRLTNLEFRLLQYFMVNAGTVIPTDRLTQHVWGYRGLGDRQALKQLMHRLRRKLEVDPQDPKYLQTVVGVGYRLVTTL